MSVPIVHIKKGYKTRYTEEGERYRGDLAYCGAESEGVTIRVALKFPKMVNCDECKMLVARIRAVKP